ncbi:hypothetical protein [Amycolatopsis sp. NPDC051716]|uniref:ATP-binding protein n=1 Tax=Amycolatopsis sp. NPDC051716 TaxID=3155804 RepID=UPI00344516A9
MRIIALEGLSGVGKSTLAPLVAQRIGAELLPAIPMDLDAQRKQADASENVTARHVFYLWAIATACQRARESATGALWLVESYIGRAMAYHLGMGSSLQLAPWTLAPKPQVSVMITCNEQVRLQRISARGEPTYWRRRSESSIESIRDAYNEYADLSVPNDNTSPDCAAEQIARAVRAMLNEGANG